MKLEIVSPTKAYLVDYNSLDIESLSSCLTYTNTAKQFELKKIQENFWFKRNNPLGWEAKIKELKSQIRQSLLFKDEAGYYIRPGSIPYLDIPKENIVNKIQYPTTKKVPWAKVLPFTLYPYQQASVEKLLQEKHGNVELVTGAGKSSIIMSLCREAGLKTAIVVPSRSIFSEMLEKFEYHLGKGKVGAFGDGKKRLGKQFTVCISDSLANVKPGTPEWEFFSKLDMLVVDESHSFAAESLEDVCHGVFSDIPYRFFMSGTQTRGDGTEKLLQSIIGNTVHSLKAKEAIDGGYIANHEFRIVKLESSNPNYNVADALEMKRIHFLRNRNIAAFIAKLANSTATVLGTQTLVLVEELSQISSLIKLLTVPYAYAHSEGSKVKLEELGLVKVDSSESVDKFNKNEVKVLIGTSCIATGTNIYPCHNVVNWIGGSSEIKTKQGAVGRATRLGTANPYKDNCKEKTKSIIYDFDVKDVFVLRKHLEDRIVFYRESGTPIEYVVLSK